MSDEIKDIFQLVIVSIVLGVSQFLNSKKTNKRINERTDEILVLHKSKYVDILSKDKAKSQIVLELNFIRRGIMLLAYDILNNNNIHENKKETESKIQRNIASMFNESLANLEDLQYKETKLSEILKTYTWENHAEDILKEEIYKKNHDINEKMRYIRNRLETECNDSRNFVEMSINKII